MLNTTNENNGFLRSRTLWWAAFGISLMASLVLLSCSKKTFVTSSMQPTIKPGEKVTVDFTAYVAAKPKRWEVLAFAAPPMYPKNLWLMRVVALPGETVAFATGGITVNGQPLTLPPHVTNVTYVSLDHAALVGARSSITSPYTVPQGCYFVLGDNSTNANDSRMWGPVGQSNILGRVKGK